MSTDLTSAGRSREDVTATAAQPGSDDAEPPFADEPVSRSFTGILAGAALALSLVALAITLHATTDTQPTRTPSPAPTLVSAPGPGEPLPAAVPVTTPPGNRKPAPPVDPLVAWAHQRATTYDIPEQALYAYGHATTELQAAQPNCHLGWTTLAAIANTESNHARFGGATIAPNGAVSPPIRGVPLDGTNGNASITTGTGGHSAYARAEGPFQFIPDTWRRWGITNTLPAQQLSSALSSGTQTSGTANGSPDNIDDAALTAGRYLCADNHDLATPAGWTAAILAYNHSTAYLDQIHSTANRYSSRYTGH